MLISGKISISVKILVAIAQAKKPIKATDIASKVGVSVSYVERFAIPMREKEIIKAKKGPGGGYFLSTLTSCIKISSVVDCILDGNSVSEGVDLVCYEQLSQVTLQDIIDKA
ncbi:hypothetical protein VPAG_00047 [Vibrio phage douglas 12A4]|uniref:hypothetical protein n=1 Tax=Vibrio phage douglas 12A4 TaxID=573171 RepID=UPI0002C0C86F|nr:hypothetical protein VPAG_00047 [Vibrio phage douglas 12A4]AGG58083.1 hypothetical protein VPAG_00047 [Vibrio phage douglas 12A4]